MPLTKLLFATLIFVIASGLHAEPFTLSDLRTGAPRLSAQQVAIGGAPDGFLLAGTASHQAVTIPLSLDGSPLTIGSNKVGVGQAMRAGEPVRVGDSWLVPLYTGFLAPDRFTLSEMRPDGSLAGEPRTLPWQGVAGGSIAWNGRTLLLAGLKRSSTSNLADLVVRTANPDLTNAGEEKLIASGAKSARIVPADDGFVIVYTTADGIFLARLSNSGAITGLSRQLSASGVPAVFDAAAGPNGTMVIWSEGSSSEWSLHVARISGDEVTEIPTQIPSLRGYAARFYIRPFEEGFLLAWQAVDHFQGRLVGSRISWMLMDADGNSGTIREIDGIPGDEVLHALGSNGDTALLVWERHIVGVGIPLYGATISNGTVSVPELVLIDYTTVASIDAAPRGDGTTFAVWRETSGTGTTLFAGRWSRQGERLSLRSFLSVEGTLGDLAMASGGGQTLILWRQGFSLLGAWLEDDATIRGEPFVVVQREDQWSPLDHPALAWDGSRFIVIWVELSDVAPVRVISGAVIAPSGVITQLGVVVEPPPATSRWGYRIVNGRIASSSEGMMIAAEVQQQFVCVGPPCPTADHVGLGRLDRDGRPLSLTVELISAGTSPDVASDGRDFLVSWQNSEGTRVRLYTPGGGEPAVDRLLLAHPFLESTRAIWNGSEYVVAWGGPRIYLALLDRALAPVQPVGAIEGHSTVVGSILAVGELPGDAFVSWVDTLDDPAGARVPVAEFASEAVAIPPPPAAPAGVTLRRAKSPFGGHAIIEISWNPVAGAEGYWIETYGPGFEGFRWFRTLLVKSGQAGFAPIADYGLERVRIRAYGIGGSSEPVESSLIAPRRRGVRR